MQERGAAPPLSGGSDRRPSVRRRLLLAGTVAALVIVADQWSKTWAVHRLTDGSIHVVWKLDLILTYNTGGAFSIVPGWAPVLGSLAVVLVAVLVVAIFRVNSDIAAVGLGLVVGGAIGNLADRLFRSHHGAVVDFVAVHFWPTFNVADASIVVGAIITGAALWWPTRHPEPAAGS